jgi:hypothetical protein
MNALLVALNPTHPEQPAVSFENWLTTTALGQEVHQRLLTGQYGRYWDSLAAWFEQHDDVGQLGLIALWQHWQADDPDFTRLTQDRQRPGQYLALWAICRGRDQNHYARRRHSWKSEQQSSLEALDSESARYNRNDHNAFQQDDRAFRAAHLGPNPHVIYRPTEEAALAQIAQAEEVDERLAAIEEAIACAKAKTSANPAMQAHLDVIVESLKCHSEAVYNASASCYQAHGMSAYCYSRWKHRFVPHLRAELSQRLPQLRGESAAD